MKILSLILSLQIITIALIAQPNKKNKPTMPNPISETVTLGAGCFWCVEAQYLQLKGILKVESGYMGGTVLNPTYKEVCTGSTGHAEVCRLTYDPKTITFDEILQAFWVTHDPTQLNRQGNDVGTQYRSVVFYNSETQKTKTQQYIQKLNTEKVFAHNIVTEVSPETTFYKAEDYHQNYYAQNQSQPYCTFVVKPKMDKFKKVFAAKLKTH